MVYAFFLYGLEQHYLISGAVFPPGLRLFSICDLYSVRGCERAERILYLVSVIGIAFNLTVLAIVIDLIGLQKWSQKFSPPAPCSDGISWRATTTCFAND